MISAGEMSNLLVWVSIACQHMWLQWIICHCQVYLLLQCYHERDKGAPVFGHPKIPVSYWFMAGLSVEAIRWSRIFFLLCSDVVIFYLIKSQREIFVNEDLWGHCSDIPWSDQYTWNRRYEWNMITLCLMLTSSVLCFLQMFYKLFSCI